MQKIMFNDKYGLTTAVLEGRKTMTRRAICPKIWEKYIVHNWGQTGDPLAGQKENREYLISLSPYKVGEVVAIAQRYCDIFHCAEVPRGEEKGWGNKMFVKADLMPHHIEITDIKVERLQDISDEDCFREGITRCGFGKKFIPGGYDTPRKAFAALIDKVSGKGTWGATPWMFAYSFKLIY